VTNFASCVAAVPCHPGASGAGGRGSLGSESQGEPGTRELQGKRPAEGGLVGQQPEPEIALSSCESRSLPPTACPPLSRGARNSCPEVAACSTVPVSVTPSPAPGSATPALPRPPLGSPGCCRPLAGDGCPRRCCESREGPACSASTSGVLNGAGVPGASTQFLPHGAVLWEGSSPSWLPSLPGREPAACSPPAAGDEARCPAPLGKY